MLTRGSHDIPAQGSAFEIVSFYSVQRFRYIPGICLYDFSIVIDFDAGVLFTQQIFNGIQLRMEKRGVHIQTNLSDSIRNSLFKQRKFVTDAGRRFGSSVQHGFNEIRISGDQRIILADQTADDGRKQIQTDNQTTAPEVFRDFTDRIGDGLFFHLNKTLSQRIFQD